LLAFLLSYERKYFVNCFLLSRFILSWDLKVDMVGGSLEDVMQQSVDFTGMTDVPLEDRTVQYL
jgi:hypothetical protein